MCNSKYPVNLKAAENAAQFPVPVPVPVDVTLA